MFSVLTAWTAVLAFKVNAPPIMPTVEMIDARLHIVGMRDGFVGSDICSWHRFWSENGPGGVLPPQSEVTRGPLR